MLPHGVVLWLVEKPVPAVGDDGVASAGGVVGDAMVDGLEPKIPSGEAAGVGTAISGLTPALPISTDPKGIPAREAPDGAGAVNEAVPVAVAAHGAALPSNIPPPTSSPPPS
jgi:hypothetical protein